MAVSPASAQGLGFGLKPASHWFNFAAAVGTFFASQTESSYQFEVLVGGSCRINRQEATP
jgi:hypothetical protein